MPFPILPPDMPRRGNAAIRWFGRTGLRLMGFRFVGEIPNLPKFVLIAGPHTTNWDFVLGMLLQFALGLRIHFIGKHTLFRGPFGVAMRWLGGIPVNRAEPGDLIEQVVSRFRTHDRYALGLSPEGTRSRVEKWKSGFYRIAVAADVPILIGIFDFGKKELRLDAVFHPTGDYEADLPLIRAHYRPEQAKYPGKYAA